MSNPPEALIAEVDRAISELVKFRIVNPDLDDFFDGIETDSFGQLVDKLLVVHIRYWHLEDEMANESVDSVLADKRRQSEPLFKIYRPMLVRALDKRNATLLKSGEAELAQLPKNYKGWSSRDT